MADIAIFRINYKSDFILTLQSNAGWLTPFCIKFWTGAPSQAYYAYYDGMSYTHCAPVDGEPTKLLVQFDDHHLPIGDLKFQIGYHFTVADFSTSVEDEVINQASVIIEVDDAPAQVMLDFNGETAPEIEFSLPAYANEAQRIANEQARIEAEEQRISNEEARIAAEQERQQNEQQRISREQQCIEQEQQRVNAEAERVSEFASLKTESEAATAAANIAATLANEKAQLADDKAALAQAAATLANEKAQLAEDKANLAQQKADYAQTQGNYAKAQGDAAKTEAEAAHSLNEEVSHDEATRQQQETARQQAEAQRVTDFNAQMQQQQTTYADAEAARDTAFDEAETERDAKVDAKVADITNLQAQIGYFVCDTNAATAAKTIAATGYALTTGGNIRIKMTNANTADSVTLNINSTGAKALFYNGTQASSTNSWEAGEVVEVYYDGTQYQCASGGGGKFATGEKVKDTSITDTIAEGSTALPTSGAVYEKTKALNEITEYITPQYTSGYYLNSSGSLVANASWKVIDFLDIQALAEGDVIVWGGITNNSAACICFYDENGTFKNAKSATGSSRTITLGSSDAALGCTKIRASFLESGTPSLTLNGVDVIADKSYYKIDGVTELQEDVAVLNEEVPELMDFKEAAEPIVLKMQEYDYYDNSGAGDIRIRFVYRNILGATVNVSCLSGYNFDVLYYAGVNPTGSALYQSGWRSAELTISVPTSGVGCLVINTRKPNNTAITYEESEANITKKVFLCARNVTDSVEQGSTDLVTGGGIFAAINGGNTYEYSGEKIRLTPYRFDGEQYMTIRHPSAAASGQGGAIYENYFVQGGAGGYVRVYDLITKEAVVDSLQLSVVDADNHVNNICFGNIIPTGGTFPYMYVSECFNQRRCFVENFTLTGSTLVQTLGYNDSNIKEANWVIDNEGGFMYLVANYIDRNTVRVIKLPFIEPASGDYTYSPSDIIDYFDLDGSSGKAFVFQGNVIKDGKLYSCFGGSAGTHRVWINDLDSHKLLNVIELDQMTGGECESINLYNGTMMIGYPNQSKLYQLTF